MENIMNYIAIMQTISYFTTVIALATALYVISLLNSINNKENKK